MFTITVERTPLRVAFEVGSLAEGIAILEEQDTQLRKIIATADDLNAGSVQTETIQTDDVKTEITAETTKRKPGRPAKDKSQPDPATANAPPPIAIPGVETAKPDLTPNANGIPAAFDRTAEVAAPPPPPPPAAPPLPPPAAAPPPPSGILAGKVIENLNTRKAVSADGGKVLAEWLVAYNVVSTGASYDEAIAAVRLMPDDKLAQVATALEVK